MENFSDLAWELLGGYIANNKYLEEIHLTGCHLTDSNMCHLFKNWKRAGSLKRLDLSGNEFGIDGIRSMVPFLKNSRNLSKLDISENRNINSECFSLLVEALHAGGSIEILQLCGCNVGDIAALEKCVLPHLKILLLSSNNIRSLPTSLENYTNLEDLYLRNNKIGKEGCRSIAKLLQKEGSRLRELDLADTGMSDEEAEILADSLKHNTTLISLYLVKNNFEEKGFVAFLKLLNDMSSIDSTYNSNHTLTLLTLTNSTNATIQEWKKHIDCAIVTNQRHRGNPHAAGRAKVIETQLNSQKREELSRLQGIGYSYRSIFANTEPLSKTSDWIVATRMTSRYWKTIRSHTYASSIWTVKLHQP